MRCQRIRGSQRMREGGSQLMRCSVWLSERTCVCNAFVCAFFPVCDGTWGNSQRRRAMTRPIQSFSMAQRQCKAGEPQWKTHTLHT